VPDPAQLPPVTFRMTPGQRGQRLYFTALLVLFGVLAIAESAKRSTYSAGLLVLGVALLAGTVPVLIFTMTTTSIDGTGVRTSGLSRRSIPWADVREISLTHSGDSSTKSQVTLSRHRGRAIELQVPYDSDSRGQRNPRFAEQYATIKRYWETASGAGPRGPAAGS
jgi:hypothetical protein